MLNKNKKLIVVPRLKKYKEHVNDHQLQITDNFAKEGYIIALEDGEKLQDALKKAKDFAPDILTKSSLMLGLGETKEELKEVFRDLRKVNCDILTLGQYLAPTKDHLEVQSYPTQDYYDELKIFCLSIGFRAVLAGPFVRSSYKAGALYHQIKKRAI